MPPRQASRLASPQRIALRCRLSAEQRAVDSFARQGIGEPAGVSHQQNPIPQIRPNKFGFTRRRRSPDIAR